MSVAAPAARPDFYTSGGALKPTAPSYVLRAADAQLLAAIKKREYCYVLTPRQMGKSSLMVRTAAKLREEGFRAAVIDLTGIGTAVTPEEWYLGQILRIAKDAGSAAGYLEWWNQNKHIGPIQRFTGYLTEVLLRKFPEPVAIFVDEIDTTLNLGFSDDYFAAIRSLYNERALDANLERIVFILLGVASPSDLIKDSKRTPFNIGRRIELTDFSSTEAKPLAAGLSPDRAEASSLLREILSWTGGHPYLTQAACEHTASLSAQPKRDRPRVSNLATHAIDELFLSERGRNTDSNLQFVRDRIMNSRYSGKLLAIYRSIRNRVGVIDDELDPLRSALKLSGLVRVETNRFMAVRNRIYDHVFDDEWLQAASGDSGSPRKSVVLSFARDDRDWVNEFLVDPLIRSGIPVIADASGGSALDGWESTFADSLSKSAHLICVLSRSYASSQLAQRELTMISRSQAGRARPRILPVLREHFRLPESMFFLADFEWLDFTGGHESGREEIERLILAIRGSRRLVA